MFTIKTLNAISPVGLSKLATNQFEVLVECPDPDGILVRSANMHEMELGKNLKAIARAGAGVEHHLFAGASDRHRRERSVQCPPRRRSCAGRRQPVFYRFRRRFRHPCRAVMGLDSSF